MYCPAGTGVAGFDLHTDLTRSMPYRILQQIHQNLKQLLPGSYGQQALPLHLQCNSPRVRRRHEQQCRFLRHCAQINFRSGPMFIDCLQPGKLQQLVHHVNQTQ
ncbi:hypothetical protein D3C73_1413310 [compost metagenome]